MCTRLRQRVCPHEQLNYGVVLEVNSLNKIFNFVSFFESSSEI